MTRHLQDVNVLLAAIVETHPKHPWAKNWLEGKSIVLCPISELGFLRIASNPGAIGLSMSEARNALEKFVSDREVNVFPTTCRHSKAIRQKQKM